jgi:hypothetical protein
LRQKLSLFKKGSDGLDFKDCPPKHRVLEPGQEVYKVVQKQANTKAVYRLGWLPGTELTLRFGPDLGDGLPFGQP